MTKVRIASIVENSVVDGEGTRTVVYFQGCSLACKGCQNFAIWNHSGGNELDVKELAKSLVEKSQDHHNYTIQGGEPTEQPLQLENLLCWIRFYDPFAHITLYTGRLWEELLNDVLFMLAVIQCDVVVDGRFELNQDDPFILWRGSRNQRPIDVIATFTAGRIVTLDWEKPRLIISVTGEVSMPVGLFETFSELGEEAKTRRCGDYRK